MNPLAKRAIQIHERLLEFYGEPMWRNPLPAIDELVSTILSQNTNDINRDRAFLALRAKFSTWEDVRDAPTNEVVEAIRPAGLANQKGPRIQQVLRSITEERGSLDLSFLADLAVEELGLRPFRELLRRAVAMRAHGAPVENGRIVGHGPPRCTTPSRRSYWSWVYTPSITRGGAGGVSTLASCWR